MKPSILNFFALLKKVKPVHYLVVAAVIALGVFNAVTAVMPQIKQDRYEKGIVKSFDKWWEEEGANQFKVVGIDDLVFFLFSLIIRNRTSSPDRGQAANAARRSM